MSRKGAYPYEYVHDWEKYNETTLPKKEENCSGLTIEDITATNYKDEKSVCKDFEIKHLGQYHYLYLRSDVLLLANIFENFREICLEMYELEPAEFFSTPGLAWQAALKNTGVELELLTDIDMLLMI